MTMEDRTSSSKIREPLAGSFRDRSGHVYEIDREIFRTVLDEHAEHFEYAESTGLLQQLTQDGYLLPASKVNQDLFGTFEGNVKYLLKIPRLSFITYPYEWSFPALKAAAQLHLEVQLAALSRGVTLSDASAYNVQFKGAQPVFIDHLSFRRYQEGEIWAGHRQFTEQFLIPLLLRSLFGVSHNAWYRGTQEGIPMMEFRRLLRWRDYVNVKLLKHCVMPASFQGTVVDVRMDLQEIALPSNPLPLATFRRLLTELRDWIGSLVPADTRHTLWQNYSMTHNYTDQEVSLKRRFIEEFIDETKPKLLWDLGCNEGEYSRIALEAGAQYVVGFDSDQGSLESCFAQASRDHLAFQALYMDMANPSPSQGWQERERPGLSARSSADGILALALIHHLAFTNNVPLSQVIDWIVDLAPTGVIEFVPKSDPMAKRLLTLRDDIFQDYSHEQLLSCLTRKTKVVKTQVVSESGRTLIWYRRT